jgi:hypothetical protein
MGSPLDQKRTMELLTLGRDVAVEKYGEFSSEAIAANTYLNMETGNLSEAEKYSRKALALSNEEPNTYWYHVSQLIELYRGEGKIIEAEALCRQSITVIERRFGPLSPELAEALRRYANFLEEQHLGDEAVPIKARAEYITSHLRPQQFNLAKSRFLYFILLISFTYFGAAGPKGLLSHMAVRIAEKRILKNRSCLQELVTLKLYQGKVLQAEHLSRTVIANAESWNMEEPIRN